MIENRKYYLITFQIRISKTPTKVMFYILKHLKPLMGIATNNN